MTRVIAPRALPEIPAQTWPSHQRPACCAAIDSALAELLSAFAELILQTQILRPLYRRHEFAQLALFARHQVETLSLKSHQLIEKSGDLLLIRGVPGHDLRAQHHPCLPLFRHERNSLSLELLIRPPESHHLIVVELQPAANQISGALANALFEHCTTRGYRVCGSAQARLRFEPARSEGRKSDERNNCHQSATLH